MYLLNFFPGFSLGLRSSGSKTLGKNLMFALLSLSLSSVASATIIVDNFTTSAGTTQFVACGGAGTTTSGSNTGTTTFGGASRNVSSTVSSVLGVPSGCADARTNFPAPNQFLTFNNDVGVLGRLVLSWNSANVIDASAETQFNIDIQVDGGIAPDDTTNFTMRFCADSTCAASLTRSWSIAGASSPISTYSFGLGTFTAAGGGSWNNLRFAELTVLSGNSADLQIDNIVLSGARVAIIPEPSTLALLGSALVAAFAVRRRQ